ncbi:carboxypeptidase-like regulatory domain-containing protein [Tenacibaculum amylolyticum]|uniref:carboxypeptidase-like regulatory domain-containing protein n=1 Tax=Tenacibaculum amylolyticum TaxID=104269 RepID=UPI003893F14C
MKKRLTIFLLLISIFTFSQQIVKGKIISENNTLLEGASVFFNNTTVGTISDSKGEFQLKIPKGNYTLVISFLGYQTYQQTLNTHDSIPFLTIPLKEDIALLDEVTVSKIVYDDEWKYNLNRFKKAFLGRSKLAESCKIMNEKDIHFDFDSKTNSLTATTRKPLIIKHNGLGYKIIYDLEDFTLDQNKLYYSGYARYENLRKSVRKKWQKNRLEAFNGSKMHFLRSLLSENLKEDGFLVHQFKRVPNPERPSEEKIQHAQQLIKLHGNSVNFTKKIDTPITPLDSALVTLRKARLPKYRDYLYKSNLDSYSAMISRTENIPFLDFKDYLMVVYTKETEEENYLTGTFGKKRKPTGVQTSNLVLLHGKSKIDPAGILIDPTATFNEGYWAFESFANLLPLDYNPKNQ